MRTQQQIWQDIHANDSAFPSYALPEPSGMVVTFVEYLKRHGGVTASTVVDIGCGKGRNSVYLAKEGFNVTGMDYIESAIASAQTATKQAGVMDRVSFSQAAIDTKWPFADNTFDLAVDCFASIDIETKAGREIYRNELYRTLKPEGCALICVVSSKDEYEAEMIATYPGEEKNSTYWPGNGKFQKDYDEAELREFYHMFTILELTEQQKPSQKMGRQYMATNYWMVVKKVLR